MSPILISTWPRSPTAALTFRPRRSEGIVVNLAGRACCVCSNSLAHLLARLIVAPPAPATAPRRRLRGCIPVAGAAAASTPAQRQQSRGSRAVAGARFGRRRPQGSIGTRSAAPPAARLRGSRGSWDAFQVLLGSDGVASSTATLSAPVIRALVSLLVAITTTSEVHRFPSWPCPAFFDSIFLVIGTRAKKEMGWIHTKPHIASVAHI